MLPLSVAVRFGAWVRIWSDSASAIAVFTKHVVDGLRADCNAKRSDRLSEMQSLASELGRHKLAVLKVPAHQDKALYKTELEHWLLTATGLCGQCCPRGKPGPEIWRLWTAHVQQLCDNRQNADLVRQCMVSVGRLWSKSGRHVTRSN